AGYATVDDEMYYACSANGQKAFPYGNKYVGGACNGEQTMLMLFEVGSLGTCVGGYAGVYDLSGNAAEWRNACNGELGYDDFCRESGGARRGPDFLACNGREMDSRYYTALDMGFRCCSNLE